jgi:methionyl-tRNA synthetase
VRRARLVSDTPDRDAKMAAERFYYTTPLYYLNAKPHIGHAYCTVLVDAMTRFRRLFGDEVHFLTGTDEHGQKVQKAADQRGLTPQQHVDELHAAFRDLWPDLHVHYDDFIRTTEPRHVRAVQTLLQRLHDQGDIYVQDYAGWYSTAAERFWAEDDLVDGKCPDTGLEVQYITERNYFFRMSKYGAALRAHIVANPGFIRPANRANEVLGFLDKGLQDLCISRPKERLSWGIPIPFDEDYVTYVWFDALTNYIAALGWPDDPEFPKWWPHAHHFIGKDILTTHSVYWTTMLMAAGVALPQSITATGWWLSGDRKMSKSLGNVVDPLGMKDVYGPEVLRYFLLRDMVVGLDSNFTEEALVRRNNSDLANDLGNLARRAAGLVGRYFGGRVPEGGAPTPDEEEIIAEARTLHGRVQDLVAELQLHTAIEETMQLVRRLNKYMTDTAPFKTIKTHPAAAARSLYTVLEGLRHAACLLGPVMPEKMAELTDALGAAPTTNIHDLRWGGLVPGSVLKMEEALFPRRDLPVTEAPAPAPAKPPKGAGDGAKAQAAPASSPEGVIAFDDFMKVVLRVATVREAERVSGSDKLLRLQVDLGEERRQVVAGIGKQFAPEDLVGRQVVMVANLAPRKIFKLESQGMILAVDTPDGGLALLQPTREVPPGAQAH